jgi:hypothetical protein
LCLFRQGRGDRVIAVVQDISLPQFRSFKTYFRVTFFRITSLKIHSSADPRNTICYAYKCFSSFQFRIHISDLNMKKAVKNAVFWVVAPCRCSELNRRFGGTYRLHLQGRKNHQRLWTDYFSYQGLYACRMKQTRFCSNITPLRTRNMRCYLRTLLWKETACYQMISLVSNIGRPILTMDSDEC